MFYVIPDIVESSTLYDTHTLLKVALNTNKTDHHVLRYN